MRLEDLHHLTVASDPYSVKALESTYCSGNRAGRWQHQLLAPRARRAVALPVGPAVQKNLEITLLFP